MRKSCLLIVALGILGLTVVAGSGCNPDLSVPGGNVWPTRVKVTVRIADQFNSNLNISWRAKLLKSTEVPGAANIGGEDSDPDMSFSTSSPPAPPFAHAFGPSARLTAGLWRFETTISGDGRSIAVVCDQVLPGSESWDNSTEFELTVTQAGCTPGDSLQATSIVTDFSEYAAGQQPYDWMPFGDPANSTWTVQAEQLQGDQTVNGARAIFWETAGQPVDVEILAKVLTHATDPNIPSPMLFVRGSGTTAATAAGYVVGLRGGDRLVTGRIQGTGAPQLNAAQFSWPFGYVANSWYWIRFKISGSNNVSVKVWPAGGVEPADPTLSFADPGSNPITGGGRVGVLTYDANADPWMDLFSVSLGGTYALPRLAQTCPNQTPPYYVCQ